MDADSVKFDVQTEGLGEFWGVAPDYRERRTRNPMTADELNDVIQTIIVENEKDAMGLFVIERSKKSLHIRLDHGIIELSDPNDANYQNIAVSINDLKSSICDFFGLQAADAVEHKSQVALLELLIAIVTGAGMLAAVYFAFNYLNEENKFMSKPDYMEVSNQEDFRNHLKEMAGVYVTKMEDGETLLSLKKNGTWKFYDLHQEDRNSFTLSLVQEGSCRPVYQKGKLAMLTDTNYLFYWESDGALKFQDRRYIRTAKLESDVPYVAFPE